MCPKNLQNQKGKNMLSERNIKNVIVSLYSIQCDVTLFIHLVVV
jgi:hypothetical protein